MLIISRYFLGFVLMNTICLSYAGGKHVHGTAEMNIVLDQNQLLIEIISPTVNIIGFEHSPKNLEQELISKQAMKNLLTAEKIFSMPAQAQCRLLDSEKQYKGHDNIDKNEDSAHSDIVVSYTYQCKVTEKLKFIDINLFKIFPAIKKLQVILVDGKGQSSTSINSNNPRLRIHYGK